MYSYKKKYMKSYQVKAHQYKPLAVIDFDSSKHD